MSMLINKGNEEISDRAHDAAQILLPDKDVIILVERRSADTVQQKIHFT